MGELTLVYGPAHPEKWTPTLERCRQILAGGQRILWLCPTPFQAHFVQRRLRRGGAQPGRLTLDLDRFVEILHGHCPNQRAPLPAAAHRLLVEDALTTYAAATPYYNRRPEGLGRGLTRLFRALEEAGIQPTALATDTPRSAELRTLYAGYRQRLDTDWVGSDRRWTAVADHLDRPLLDRLFPGLELFVLCNFNAVAAPFLPVLERLIELVPQTTALIDCDPEVLPLFARSRPLYQFLAARARTCVKIPAACDPIPGRRLRPPALRARKRRNYRPRRTPILPRPPR